jgi:hypothetical protein
MSKAIRIKTTPNGGDKYIKIKLEQDFDFLEVLSLNINQEDVYKRFSSDYGVIVGRVIINGGFGVPNAKVSVFIPLDNIDKNDVLKRGLYPYEKVSDKDVDGIRYNLLTQDSASQNECFTPIGTFPLKREVLDNDVMLEVYCKYYKFTTTTNYAGDFMIFGVPLGNHVVHLDADISDIGIASQRPYDMISKGVSPSRFDSTTKFSSGTNLDKLIQVKSLDSGVNVQPFWGDTESYEVGITRLDLDLNYDITPSAIFMGSIFGDHQKNSVNKNCRPRRQLGELKEQISSEGTIRMIRKTINNKIEEFNVDGSELIDENGAWAYQIPMNLDYMVTDESGDLILSQDPNKGIPTRARVRFNIGMTDNGGAGRIRTRARYLVPHNPKLIDEIDYEFGNKTNDKSFRDLSWNKIYTVSNFISKFQSRAGLTRAATGIKDVDGSDGNKTVFPFNKVNTETSPLFLILCIIINIIVNIVSAINTVIVGGINAIITFLNKARIIRVKRLFRITLWSEIKCLKCITIECGDPAEVYQPGCGGCGRVDNANTNTSSLIKCFLTQLARALNIFQFDFYNDWVNGSLYSFLLKYKKKKNKQEKFCDYECGDGSTNRCSNSSVIDTCIPNGSNDAQKETRNVNIREGLIKKYNNELYYAATDKTTNLKLFSTELVNLGSIFECDWQGIPKIQELLIPTSYKLPPDAAERDDNLPGEPIITTGMVDIDECGLFFNIDCGGVHSDARQVLNIRHACEMGVNLDEAIEDANGVIIKKPDCRLGLSDIDDLNGKWFRDVFLGLNNSKTPWKVTNGLSLPYTSEFNLNDSDTYNFVNNIDNGIDYSSFRNYSFNNSTPNPLSFGQPDHSYYFYFGLEPGNTGLDKMNKKFFASCIEPIKNDIIIESNSIPDNLKDGNGCIIFSFIGGIGPFNYTVSGLNDLEGKPLNITPIVGSASTNSLETKICKLYSGIYSIDAVDSLGSIVNDIITVNGPIPLYCFANVSAMLSKETTSDGAIKIDNVGGGVGILRYELKNSKGTIVSSGLATSNLIINNLAGDSIGYTLLIYDESSPRQECITNNLVIVGRSVLSVTSTIKNIHCFGVDDGEIKLNIIGGVSPYKINITGPEDYSSKNLISSELKKGQYTATVVDSVGSATTLTVNIDNDNPELIIEKASEEEVARQCDSNNYVIPFDITSGFDGVTSEIEYSLNGGESWAKLEPVPKKAANNRYTITLGRDSISQDDGIAIRFWSDKIARFDDAGVRLPRCYSEEITYERSEIELTPVLTGPFIKDGLGSNYTAALDAVYQNKKQCSSSIATYTFSINHLDTGFTGRAPYTIDYHVESLNSTPQKLTHYGGLVTLKGTRNTGTFSDDYVEFFIRVTDNKGCVFPTSGWYTPKIQLPKTELSKTIVTTGPFKTTVNNVFGDYYKHVVNVTGGVPFTNNTLKLGNGTTIKSGIPETIYTSSLVLVDTVTDANGCVINIIG